MHRQRRVVRTPDPPLASLCALARSGQLVRPCLVWLGRERAAQPHTCAAELRLRGPGRSSSGGARQVRQAVQLGAAPGRPARLRPQTCAQAVCRSSRCLSFCSPCNPTSALPCHPRPLPFARASCFRCHAPAILSRHLPSLTTTGAQGSVRMHAFLPIGRNSFEPVVVVAARTRTAPVHAAVAFGRHTKCNSLSHRQAIDIELQSKGISLSD